ncbi:MAG TPA: hypothetical protein VKT18_10535, partial [Acidimicrobiales bacterium]|nr:hypothetical protein [Acidimicrobiales bacterium]
DRDELVVNLGTGTGASVAEVLAAVRAATAHPVPARVVPRRPGDPSELVAANSLAREVLGWAPTRALDVIVRDAWAARSVTSGT